MSRSHDLALAKFGGERPSPLVHDHRDGFLRDPLPDEELAVLELTYPAFWSVTTTLVRSSAENSI